LIPLERITGNRIGDVARDFCYVTADGTRHLLSETTTDGMTLLLFYDPDCDNCRTTIARLRTDAIVNKAVAQKRLTVLAVYTEEDYDRWRASLKDMPANWTVATDHAVVATDELYVLTVMPALYLLDHQKRVRQKDSITAIRQCLSE
jgi:peroxiredoxin